jgi:hypothetical protein
MFLNFEDLKHRESSRFHSSRTHFCEKRINSDTSVFIFLADEVSDVTILWHVTPCGVLGRHQPIRGLCCSNHQMEEVLHLLLPNCTASHPRRHYSYIHRIAELTFQIRTAIFLSRITNCLPLRITVSSSRHVALYCQDIYCHVLYCRGARGGVVVKAPRYNPAGRGFDSQ